VIIKTRMPISMVEVKEFRCAKCGYKWVNRVNGRDGPLPKRCAKCKKHGWNDESGNITPEENGLRRRIKGYKDVYHNWSGELTEKFFNLHPRPTIKDLRRVVYPPGLLIGLTKQNLEKVYFSAAQEPAHPLRYNDILSEAILRSEAQMRQDIMEQIISDRERKTKKSDFECEAGLMFKVK
jgi:hypothetical protein